MGGGVTHSVVRSSESPTEYVVHPFDVTYFVITAHPAALL